MSTRPATLCKLQKNKLIDSNEGFVDTYNWMVDFINNLKGDDNFIDVDKSTSDHPKIKYIGGSSGSATNVQGDADIALSSGQGQFSIQTTTLSGLSGDQSTILQIYGFADGLPVTHAIDRSNPTLSGDEGTTYSFLVRKQGEERSEIEYADVNWQLSSAELSIDINGNTTVYDGSEGVLVSLSSSGVSAMCPLTILQNGTTIATYDGSVEVSADLSTGLSGITVYGTDGNYAECTKSLTFKSAADSNVSVGVESDGQGGVTLNIGVYYI